MITVADFHAWVQNAAPEAGLADASLNGLQFGFMEQKISRAAFALDACMAVFERAAALEAQLVFTHHGLLWGVAPLTGNMCRRLSFLAQKGMALYASHLPLDRAARFGNNAALAAQAGLKETVPFAQIGCIGCLPEAVSAFELGERVFGLNQAQIWPFNDQPIERAAVISGGAARLSFAQAAKEAGAQAFITGENNHQIYHYCLEENLAWIAGGHYASEMIGLKIFMQTVQAAFPALACSLIEVPTGV